MLVTATLVVKGSRYYKTADALRNGNLAKGALIQLVHERDNPHDRNAVAVFLRGTGDRLGHLARERAPKYASLLDRGRIRGSFVSDVSVEHGNIKVRVSVTYAETEPEVLAQQENRLWQTASALISGPGVYAIQNVSTHRQYIGSSTGARNRVKAHFRELSFGTHANHALQSDFQRYGADQFEARLMKECPTDLAVAEREVIDELLRNGSPLYNLTIDGRGTPRGRTSLHRSVPISDRDPIHMLNREQQGEIRSLRASLSGRGLQPERDGFWLTTLPFWLILLFLLLVWLVQSLF